MERFRKLALANAGATYLLVVVGAVVRATGSGLGCPDWPRCHGSWIPPLERTALIEYSHRTLAAVVGLLVLGLVVVAWRDRRRGPARVRWSLAALGLVAFQAWLGRVVVLRELEPLWVTAHLGAAMALLALVVFLAVPEGRRGRADVGLARRLWAGAAGVYLLVILGAFVRGAGAALVFPDWPLMDGELLPGLGSPARLYHFAHRAVALVVGAYLLYLVVYLRRRADPGSPSPLAGRGAGGGAPMEAGDPQGGAAAEAALVKVAWTLLGLYVVQSLAGAATIWFGLHPAARVAHVGLAALVWVTAVLLALLGSRWEAAERLRAYAALTKPRIIELLLVTTVPSMVLAAGGWPGWRLVLATLAGGTLSAAGANAINSYLDRDIDRKMRRTSWRPLPTDRIEPSRALAFGIGLGAAGFLWLWVTVNPLAAALATAALVFYVVVYTLLLKRSTAHNIVIGGAAGAVPVLVGWAAVTGRLDPAAWVLFAIVFYWTPPHFWALALRYREDYRRAGVPMLPVVRGVADTTRRILRYTVVLVAVTLLLYPVAGMGALYLGAALGLGAYFIWEAWRLSRAPERSMALFRYSIVYLALLFISIGADRVV